jgi:hypothetical protein
MIPNHVLREFADCTIARDFRKAWCAAVMSISPAV